MTEQLWSVAVDAPLLEPLTYSSKLKISRGQKVRIPLGKRYTEGVVLNELNAEKNNINSEFEIKFIQEVVEEYPQLPESFLKWLEWLADYYIHPVGQVTQLAYPPLSRHTKKNVSNKKSPVIKQVEIQKKWPMTEEQSSVFANISKHKNFSTHLLFGVTGSGKTEVYMNLFEKCLEQGKTGLFLVPEISLTPQLIQRFSARFGDKVAALHSQLTDRERTNQWWEIVEEKKSILIGARSALFCPIKNLGLIIVDEEHEPSFKQDEKLKYHGRDAAVMLAKLSNCPIVLGSATPSLESWKNALDGKYFLHEMKNRVGGRALPELEVVDMRQFKDKEQAEKISSHNLPGWLSPQLYEKIVLTLESQNQVALFLNRRGTAQLVLCPLCGHTRICPNCDINLTLHGRSHLVCHYCDYHESLTTKCPECTEGEIKPVGLGTELIESDLEKLFPNFRIARADRDEITKREDLEQLIEKMETGKIDILIGTQMIAKGLDFPNLKLVGLVLADIGFNLPDFRSTERSFQLITQMSGRSGRHIKENEEPGKVIIQTYNPDNESIQFALNHDYVGFANSELNSRSMLSYPPLGKLVSFRIQGKDLHKTRDASSLLANRSKHLQQKNENYKQIEILGPAEAPLAKLRGNYRYNLLIKGSNSKILNSFVRQVIADKEWIGRGIKITTDVDPINLL